MEVEASRFPSVPIEDHFAGASVCFGKGRSFMAKFDEDEHASKRSSNIYYPFSCREDWEFASYLLRSSLTMEEIDDLLALTWIKKFIPLSFKSAKELRSRAELLPPGPQWRYQEISIDGFPTKDRMVLYYRDGLECIESLFSYPMFAGRMEFCPRKVFTSFNRQTRVYSEWMTSDGAWETQNLLPQGATLLGTILSSDKTLVSVGTGNRVAHPVLISLANIFADVRVKASHHAMLLAALLPCPKFLNKFGDPFRHEPRTGSTTLAQIDAIATQVDPWDLASYFKEAKTRRLNGVHLPFWRDWNLSDPSLFLTPEPLHQWHKFFWDHEVKWCRHVLGDAEMDFRFSVLHPHSGFHHFKEGISQLKQVTGREHRDMQRYLVACIAGAAPRDFVACIHSLMDFRYLAQFPTIDDNIISDISTALHGFHAHKHAVLAAGACTGKGNKPILNWHIPKLELMQSVVPSVRWSGAPIQYTADATEHAHRPLVKEPARTTNYQDINPQVCRHLDRAEKRRLFDLATSMRAIQLSAKSSKDSGPPVTELRPVERLDGPARTFTDYFDKVLNPPHTTTSPLRTFADHFTALHLNNEPSIRRITVDSAAIQFGLSDLCPALGDFLLRCQKQQESQPRSLLGGRRVSRADCHLPFTELQIWFSIRVQNKSPYDVTQVLRSLNLQASPPDSEWPLGRYDAVLLSHDPDIVGPWPLRSIQDHSVAQIRMVMRPLWMAVDSPPYLVYAQRFDIVSQGPLLASGVPAPDPASGMYVLKRALRTDGSRMGDVVPISHIRLPLDLVGRFGSVADVRLSETNSLECSSEFLLNKYWDKETFVHLR
ncbi:hypothetical protein JAAARDRAFT_57695 [Jaapia argillacea MUCL 33604]|uniref:DUF6830 domain-containing protein n=1 Tax=Jaapia argillacea MUCL 33604 TaxID=933084 RepID=A0A067Q2Z9_9AGAM|nr:hypothetical protein JAAARDRAFT_57695 [Jaapia argillacea MUCL 33604]